MRLFAVQSGMNESFGNGLGKLIDISGRNVRYDNDEGSSISFLTAGNVAGTFSWNEERTLSQIEQMTGFSVKPRGVVSKFKNGGYIVSESNGHGLVMAACDLGRLNWADAKTACDDFGF